LAKELDELIRTTKTNDGKNVVQIIADKVGYVDLRHGTVDGNAIVAGYIGSQQTSPRPASPSRPTKDEDKKN